MIAARQPLPSLVPRKRGVQLGTKRGRYRDYHASLEPWIAALRKLKSRGWSDSLTAKALSSLTLTALEHMGRIGTRAWDKHAVDAMIDECDDGSYPGKRSRFSRRRVIYYVRRLGLERKPVIHGIECRSLLDRRRAYQDSHAFGHLLPLVLRRREVDVLRLLKDRGPMTIMEMAAALDLRGPRPLWSNGRSNLRRLVKSGLVKATRSYTATSRWLFALADSAKPLGDSGRKTGIERVFW